jgi:5-oxopent-3-ene-1,2,5-tricarboxylate decarboxylase/2-hydroxyhepta-2,4-diene-1,7-dioate isomerase
MLIGDIEINPTKIICLGLNYKDHVEETGRKLPDEPVIFTKSINCLILNNAPIIYPLYLFNNRKYNRVDFEAELAFIVKDRSKNVPIEDVYEHILGYTIFNDLTARKMQIKDYTSNKPWYRSKSFDTFGPIGPKIVSPKDIPDPHNLNIELSLNGEIKQSSNTKYLIFKVPEILNFVSQFFTMEPGDIIATGTPSGISPIKPGDTVEITIEKIGTLTNRVVLEQ